MCNICAIFYSIDIHRNIKFMGTAGALFRQEILGFRGYEGDGMGKICPLSAANRA
jgi:hypothetical protein